MNKGALILSIMVTASQGAASYLRDDQPNTAPFPLYAGATAAAGNNDACKLLAETSTTKYGGYQCVRKGEVYAPP